MNADLSRIKAMLSGPVASISIPFDKKGDIDYPGLQNYIEYVIQSGVTALLMTPGDTHYSLLTDNEVAEITKAVIKQSNNRTLVITAAKQWGTSRCIKYARFACQAGADLLLSCPYIWGNALTAESLADHYRALGREIPVMFYAANESVILDAMHLLIHEDNGVLAVKDDACGPAGRRIASLVRDKWGILSGGLKENHLDSYPYGSDGYLSVYCRFKAEVAFKYWHAVKNNDFTAAVAIIEKYERPFMDELTIKTGLDFDALIHAAMELFKIAGRWRRTPFTSADDCQMEMIKDFFIKLNLI